MAAPRRVEVKGGVREIVRGGGQVPPGGSTGQALVKASNADYDFTYAAVGGNGGGGGSSAFFAFGVIATPNDDAIEADTSPDTLTVTSPDETLIASTNPLTKTLGLIVNIGTTVGTVMGGGYSRVTDSKLAAIRALATPAADQMMYWTSATAMAFATSAAYGRSLMGSASATAARTLLGLSTFEWSWQIETVAVKTYVVCESTPFAGTLTTFTRRSGSGSATMGVLINGAAVTGLSGLSAGTTQASATATANHAFAAGARITLVVSANTACLDLAFSLAYTR